MKIGKRFHFEAAHYLPGHKGECQNLHGHTYGVKVEIEGLVDTTTGMIIDFAEFSHKVKEVLSIYDHSCLNDYILNPTVENLVIKIHQELLLAFNGYSESIYVSIQEGEGGWARC